MTAYGELVCIKHAIEPITEMCQDLDLTEFGNQSVISKCENKAVFMKHQPNALHFEFEGFGELFGFEAIVHYKKIYAAGRNLIGLNNYVCVYYENKLPFDGVGFCVIPSQTEPSY